MTRPDAVIVACARSPIGRAFKGSLREMRPDDMAVQMIGAALAQVPELDPFDIEDIVAGYTQPQGETDYNVARNLAVELGWDSVPGTTVTRYCSSSLQSTRMAFHAIRSGEGDVFLSVGLESVSRHAAAFPQPLPDTRHPMFLHLDEGTAAYAAGGRTWSDPREHGGIPDLFIGMGLTAENVAQLMGITREEQDEFALASQQRAAAAIERGFFATDITPIRLDDGTLLTADDGPRPQTTLETLAGLPPAFRPDGTVTAGNCCPLNDGAAAVVVMSDRRAAELGITPLARIVATAATGLSPEIMGLGPVEASRLALRRAGLTMADIDLVEINEAFAAQVIGSARELAIPHDKLNVNGGGIALGHPFGATGARILTTLLHSLAERDAQFGLETMCVGGGQGMAMIVERLR
ncbi:MAG: acetyl-CoA C-acetyltransferase [Jatrophihabitans sp.]|uniref:acetyl-CoA C-acetyltransferase n=1 Tax=Jatrophihabitans sp. TaxID=1932789 RepID=UPI003F80565B